MAEQTMRAVQFHAYGPPENLVIEEVACPQPQAGEVRVRVRAIGVQPFDWKLRRGYLQGYVPLSFPHTPGVDFAGVVDAVGPEVRSVRVGDEVYGAALRTCAEYAIARPDTIAPKPANLSFVEAAAVPHGAGTAWAALEIADLRPGQRLLVQGGAGGVGHFVVQFARLRGVRVIATASAANLDLLHSLGAEEAIDYPTIRFEDLIHDVDAVIDLVGGEVLDRSMDVVAKDGIVVTAVGMPSEERAAERGIRVAMVAGRVTAELLQQWTGLIEAGRLYVQVADVLPMAAVREAYARSETGHSRGRLVLEVSRQP